MLGIHLQTNFIILKHLKLKEEFVCHVEVLPTFKKIFFTVQSKIQKWLWIIFFFFLLQSCCSKVQYIRMPKIYLKMVHSFKYAFYIILFRIFEEFSEFDYYIMTANWIMEVRSPTLV